LEIPITPCRSFQSSYVLQPKALIPVESDRFVDQGQKEEARTHIQYVTGCRSVVEWVPELDDPLLDACFRQEISFFSHDAGFSSPIFR